MPVKPRERGVRISRRCGLLTHAALVLMGAMASAIVPSNARAEQAAQQTSEPQQTRVDPVDQLWRTKSAEPTEPAQRFSVVGLRFGADHAGRLTAAGKGRFFAPFGRRSALQVEGSYDWYRDRLEGQLDIGLVNRVRRVQVGLFSSVRYMNLDAFEHGRSLSQFGGTLDYVFAAGRIGVYGTAALDDIAILGRRLRGHYVYDETYLRLIDQFGASWQADVSGRLQVEGHIAILKPTGLAGTTGGSLRVAYPMSDGWALTAEAAWNASLVAPTAHGRFTVGIRMGEWPSARASSSSTRPAPIEIPAIRYQTVTRQVRDGNDGPFADAGPDQVILPECQSDREGRPIVPCFVPVTLDAGGSFDPEGDPIAYAWTPRFGFAAGQSPAPAANRVATFQGLEGQTYVVRLQVTDDRGATAFDEVTVTILKRK